MNPKRVDPVRAIRGSQRWSTAAAATGTTLAMGLAQAFTGLGFIVIARRVETSLFGLFAATYGASTTFGLIVDFGSSQRITRELAAGRASDWFASWLIRRTVIAMPFVALFSFGCSRVTGQRLGVAASIALSSQPAAMLFAAGCLAACRALRTPLLASWAVAAGNFAFLVVALVVDDSNLILGASVAATGSWLVTASACLLLLRKRVARTADSPGNPWVGSSAFGLFGVAVAAQGLDLAVLSASVGPSIASTYAAVARWIQPLMMLAQALAAQLYPSLSRAQGTKEAVKVLRTGRTFNAFALCCAALLAMAAPLLVSLLLGPRYEEAGHLLRLLSVACIPALLAQPRVALLQARHMERWVAGATATLSGGLLFLNFVAAPHFGANAIPMAWAASFTLYLIAIELRIRRALTER